MDLNWTPEVFGEFIAAIFCLSCVLLIIYSSKVKNIKSLFYIKLSFICMALFFFLSGLSILFLDVLLNKISVMFLFPASILVIIGITNIMKDSFFSLSLVAVLSLGPLLFYLIYQPNMIQISISNGYRTLIWVGLFQVITYILMFIYFFSVLYWGFKTWLNAPFLIKKEAAFLFFGLIIVFVMNIFISITVFLFPNFHVWSVVIGDIIAVLGAVVFIISIIREPKLLYILPFTVNRILVKDKDGFPLFDHDWSRTEVSELMFTGFINTIQVMSEEVIKKGGLVDIILKEGILILYNSELITVGLVASKSSKMLRDSLVNFSIDFQKMFERELKKSVRDISVYKSAYELIQKYFSNFPYRMITSKNFPLLLSGKYLKIPLALDNKLKDFIADDEDYEFIKSEMLKYPIGMTDNFLNLYKEMKEDLNKLQNKEHEQLDLVYDEDI